MTSACVPRDPRARAPALAPAPDFNNGLHDMDMLHDTTCYMTCYMLHILCVCIDRTSPQKNEPPPVRTTYYSVCECHRVISSSIIISISSYILMFTRQRQTETDSDSDSDSVRFTLQKETENRILCIESIRELLAQRSDDSAFCNSLRVCAILIGYQSHTNRGTS